MGKLKDKYVNMAYSSVTESAANTLTFSEIQTGVSMFDKIAWIVHQILWFPGQAMVQELDAESDEVNMALTVSNKVVLGLDDPAIIDLLDLLPHLQGAGVSGHVHERPIVRDFTSLPGGGLIIPPRPVYLAIKGEGLAAAGIAMARIYYTHLELTPEDYWELVEARRMIS